MTTPASPAEPPISDQLTAEIREALARAERGETVDLGSFAQHADIDAEYTDDALSSSPSRVRVTDEDGTQRNVGPRA